MPADRVSSGKSDLETATISITGGSRAARGIPVQRFSLSVIEGPGGARVWRSRGSTCAIGSHPRCDLVVDDPTVSRFHCEISVEARIARIRDCGSRNGTVVDGVSVVDAHLRDGSIVQIGHTRLGLHLGPGQRPLEVSEHPAFGLLVGASAVARHNFHLLGRAAATDATVLLEGETGTGKTQAARSIHREGKRRDGRFVVLDCAAIPASLLESELFGHVKGAFTGADGDRQGAFEEADGGTLLLDEIGEVPFQLQAKLLGVLENREVRRLGSNVSRPVDVRLIAATNRDLRAEVNAGRFRADLYFRLAVVRIVQPPLRERPDDLPMLARAILTDLGATNEQIDSLLTEELLTRIRHASWPGNIRELRNYFERCLVFDEIVPVSEELGSGTTLEVATSLPYADARQRVLRSFEREYFSRLLARHSGEVAAAANTAGIDRTHLYRILRKHKLPR